MFDQFVYFTDIGTKLMTDYKSDNNEHKENEKKSFVYFSGS